jgi:hypothetical protein
LQWRCFRAPFCCGKAAFDRERPAQRRQPKPPYCLDDGELGWSAPPEPAFLATLFDAQIDDRQRELFGIAFDTADISRDQFVVAGDAWSLCRSGKADPSAFGILNTRGLWFIAGNIIRDVAALNNREMPPWTFGAHCVPETASWIFPFFDRLAVISRKPDVHANKLTVFYRDELVGVPGTVSPS